MTKPVVLIAEELSPATVEALGPRLRDPVLRRREPRRVAPAIADVDAILVRSATKVDAEAIAEAKNLKVVARAGVGLDNVDVKAATEAGVMVVNAPTSNILSAAEWRWRFSSPPHATSYRPTRPRVRGEWKRSGNSGVELADKVVGVVGLGRIGVLVAQRLSAFGVQLIAYDPTYNPPAPPSSGAHGRTGRTPGLVGLHYGAPAQDPGDPRPDR